MKSKISCENVPPWYEQLIRFDESKKEIAAKLALDKIKKAKPDAYKFITANKMKLVGFMPNVAYNMPDDSKDALDVTFIHDFSQYTLLYWCEDGGFAFFINASLKFDDDMGFTY